MISAEKSIQAGVTHQQAGRWKQALRHYSQAIALTPDEAIPYQLRGALYVELGRYYDALHDFDRSIQLAPYSEIGYLGKAQVFVALKDYRWAVIQYTNAIDQLPNDAPELTSIYLERADVYDLLGQAGLAEADRLLAQG